MLPALYLLPVTLGDTPVETVLPSYNKEVILGSIISRNSGAVKSTRSLRLSSPSVMSNGIMSMPYFFSSSGVMSLAVSVGAQGDDLAAHLPV